MFVYYENCVISFPPLFKTTSCQLVLFSDLPAELARGGKGLRLSFEQHCWPVSIWFRTFPSLVFIDLTITTAASYFVIEENVVYACSSLILFFFDVFGVFLMK